MLKGIPKFLSPELLKALSEMGHGDRLVIADGNFPAESKGKDAIVIRCDGHGIPEILEAVLTVFPLDDFVDKAAWLMQVPGGGEEPEIWKKYRDIIEKHERKGTELLADMPKPEFMEETRKTYLIIASGESALYANIMLQKGCV